MKTDITLLEAALVGYQSQLDQIERAMAEIRSQIGRPVGRPAAAAHQTKRVISAAGRQRIADAQKKRWAAYKKSKGGTAQKRNMSPEARKRIADATKKRWAEYRAQKAAVRG